MKVTDFTNAVNADFYTGVPDSLLKSLSSYLMDTYGINGKNHIIAANEGNAVGLAAGYHLSTGKIPVVYMQNSGEGNVVNPVASLLNKNVYGIPAIFVVGWRGEPGVHDEPQHKFQGQITLDLLNVLDIPYFIIDKTTTAEDIKTVMQDFEKCLNNGDSVAFVVKKGSFEYNGKAQNSNPFSIKREEAIEHITHLSEDDLIVCTTGKASRELFEIREWSKKGHDCDFLTVGSMGHCSSIALGVALNKPNRKVWCIDGDGSALMHLGAMATLGSQSPDNLIHVVINNHAHESVGGMPTVAATVNFVELAKASGYKFAKCVASAEKLDELLHQAKKHPGLAFVEIDCAIGSRSDLGRPTTSAANNAKQFQSNLIS